MTDDAPRGGTRADARGRSGPGSDGRTVVSICLDTVRKDFFDEELCRYRRRVDTTAAGRTDDAIERRLGRLGYV